MASDKSAEFANVTKAKELQHRLPSAFLDERKNVDKALDGALPTQREFGGKFVAETPDEDLKMRMKSQFAKDQTELGQTMIAEHDYDYMLKKYKQERYLKALNMYDRMFDLRDPYQVRSVVRRAGQFPRYK